MQRRDGGDRVAEVFLQPHLLDKAMAEAAQLCFWRHKRLLQPIVVFRDGKIVHVPPEEIELDPTIIDPETGKLR